MYFLCLLTVLVVVVDGDIIKRGSGNDCYRCTRWDDVGNGYLPSDNPRQCQAYRQCFTKNSDSLNSPVNRLCPVGSWTNFADGSNENPCTSAVCDPDMCDDCEIEDTVDNTIRVTCPLERGYPGWMITRDSLGWKVPYGTCGHGGFFDDSDGICSCTAGCTCRVNIPLEPPHGIEGISCHKSWIGQTGMPAMVLVGPGGPQGVSSFSGIFNGYELEKENGAHLTSYTLNSAFAGHWVHKLTFVAWFKLDPSYTGQRQGVITMSDCAMGPAFAIWVDNFKVQGHIELIEGIIITDHVIETTETISTDTWYFTSVVYNSQATERLKLYVFTEQEYARCAPNPSLQSRCPQAAPAMHHPRGSVSPRACGLTVGHTGSEDISEIFYGRIGQVKINLDANSLLACE